MKFSQADISNLNSILNVCALTGIDAVLISETGLRAINVDRTCVFIGDNNVPLIEGSGVLGLSKLKVLKSRLELFKNDPKLAIEVKQKPNGDFISLQISGTQASVQFRTTSPVSIQDVPRSVDDTPIKRIFISREEANMILSAQKAMGSEKLTISIKGDGAVVIDLADKNNDVFSIDLALQAVDIGESTRPTFISYYFADVLCALLRSNLSDQELEQVEIDLYEYSAVMSVDGYKLTLLSPLDGD